MDSGPEKDARGGRQPRARARLGFWERRYLLRHYRRLGDATLAQGCGLPEATVRGFLERLGAVRSAGDVRRIEERGQSAPPEMFSWGSARRALTKLSTRPLTRLDAVLIGALGIASLVLYALTCARTVTGEDAGEFLAAAHGFGVPHPPGYPLWLLLAWTADHAASVVSVAWRVAMVSAVFSAAANALLLAVLLKTLRSRLAAVTAAALFGVSLTHWTQAVIPEVYGLNTFFIALQLLLLVRLAERPTPGRLVVLAFVTGLSCTNHTSALPVGALVVVGALLVAPQLLRSRGTLALAALAGLLPLVLYLVLPLASARYPYVDWGHPRSAATLWQHVTRQQYAEVEVEQQASGGGAGENLRRLSILAHWAGRQFGAGWVLLLAVLGCLPLFVRQTGLWLFLVALGWLSSVGITQYTAFPFEREHIYAVQIFWIPAWLALAWMIGGGLDALVQAAARWRARRGAWGLAGLACAALVAWPASTHFAVADRSRTTAIADFGKAILDTLEPGALYFPSSDHSTFSVMYWQGVEGYRPDVVIADKYGRIEPEVLEPFLDEQEHETWQGLSGAARRGFEEVVLIHKWPGPVYFANRRESGDLAGLRLEPMGPVFKVLTAPEGDALWIVNADGHEPPGLAAWDRCLSLIGRDARERLDFTVQMVEGDMRYMRGYALLRAGRLDDALSCWTEITGDLAPLKQALNNIGSALAESGRLADAVPFFDRARDEDSRYVLALRNEALVLRNLGDKARAIELLQRLVEVDPDQRDGRLELARLLDEADRPLEALAQYEALAAADENDPAPWREAAELLARRGDRAKAEQAFREVLRLVPGDARVAEDLQQLVNGDWPVDLADQITAATFGPPIDAQGSWPEPLLPPRPPSRVAGELPDPGFSAAGPKGPTAPR
ncbi:MAG TPA: DUF2723 domain-containing protein [Planctomycetota bacterium]|nr:DUF2723 domain-containing protein [Planctomycetota bacterium]